MRGSISLLTFTITLLGSVVFGQSASAQDVVSANPPEDVATAESDGDKVFSADDVVVTGTRTEKKITDSPVRTQLITRDLMDRKDAFNLGEALDGEPGIRVEANCQNCGFWQVRMNGLEGRYTQILIDGRPVVSSLAGVYLLEQAPEEMIERLEIVKGGGSSLYGGNAIGGVINVITSKPNENFANITLEGCGVGLEGPDSRMSAAGGLVNKDRTLRLQIYGQGRMREAWDANDDEFSEVGRLRNAGFGFNAFADPFKGGELSLKFHLLHEDRRGGDQISLPEHDVAIAESIKSRRYGGDIAWKHQVSDLFGYEVGYGIAYTERHSYYGGGGDVGYPELPGSLGDFTDETFAQFADDYQAKQLANNAYGFTVNPVHVADALVRFNFKGAGKHTITTGFQFQADSLEDKAAGYQNILPPIDETYLDYAGYVQHEWKWADWGQYVLGVRVDKHSELADPIASPRLSLMFEPIKDLRLRTAVSTGFRAPQVFDEDLHITVINGDGQWITNSSDLKHEQSYSVSQQIEYEHMFRNRWAVRGSVNGFFTQIDNAFTLDEDDDPSTEAILEFTRINRGQTRVYGLEAEVGVKYGKLFNFSTAWTWERAENDTADPDFNSKRLFRTPEVYGNFTITSEPYKGLQVSTMLDITGPMDVPHYEGFIAENRLEKSPWFAEWDISLSYRHEFGNKVYVKPFLAVKNILNSYQDDFDTGASRDAGYIYGPRLPRTMCGGVKVGF